MRKFYQKEWHGIKFDEICKVSDKALPTSDFYNTFYSKLFEIHDGFQSLELNWREEKNYLGEFILSKINANTKLLSCGCGLGYIEQYIWTKTDNKIDLHVYDFAEDALRWIKANLPSTRIHTNLLGEYKFDYIYLCSLDYALTNPMIIALLKKLKSQLNSGGKILLISASFNPSVTSINFWNYWLRDITKHVLCRLGFYSLGQFWGWKRSRSEYRQILSKSQIKVSEDGFIPCGDKKIYYIEGICE